jgi:hypothetical protein
VFKNLDGLFPTRLLLVVDFSEVKHVALHDLVAGTPFVFYDRPVGMYLAIFLSLGAAQKHDGD